MRSLIILLLLGHFGVQSWADANVPIGTIKSPNYPENYANNEDVTFPLEVDPGSRIKLDFTSFDLEYQSDCDFDYVKVLDTDGTSELAKLCGSSLPPYYISSGNKMTVVFHSDYSVVRKGFLGVQSLASTWATANVTWSFVGDSDSVSNVAVHTDPNVALSLDNLQTVLSAMGQIEAKTCIQLTNKLTNKPVRGEPWLFISRDNMAFNLSCQLDYIKDNLQGKDIAGLGDIYGQLDTDGACQQKPYAFYGARSPQNLFLGQYDNDPGHILHELVRVLGGSVSGVVNAKLTSGEVLRLNKMYCVVDGSWGEWSEFSKCSNDLDDISVCKRKKVRSCDNPAPTHGGNQCSGESDMFENCISEETDPTNNNCGINETVMSPNYPENYPDDQHISWGRQVDTGTRIKLTFTSFDLEAQSDCQYDYVKVLDSDGTTELAKLCGSSLPPIIISSGNRITVVFHSNDMVTKKGFSVTRTQVL